MLCDALEGWDAGRVGGRSKREGILYIDIYRCIDRALSLYIYMYVYGTHTHTCVRACTHTHIHSFSSGPSGKEPACQRSRCERLGFDPCVGRCTGGGHGNPLQCSCWETPVDRGARWATVHKGRKDLNMTEET